MVKKNDNKIGPIDLKKGERIKGPIIVVGIGASAGGLEAFQKFLKNMPSDSGLAFVLIQHLDPNHETMMPELLTKCTAMTVTQVKDRTRIQANQVYFIPPNATLTIEKGILRVNRPKESHGHRTPIDLFFYSLAESEKENSIAIILSGTGSDGTIGLKAVKESGGMTVAQTSESAKYDSMPRSAVATGLVDYTLAVEEIPQLLVNYAKHRETYLSAKGPDELFGEAKKQLKSICVLLKKNFNHDFSQYKESTLVRRIQRRMQMRQTILGKEYVGLLRREKEELELLFKDFLIGVTYFFRDKDCFDALEKQIIPAIFANPENNESIRVWVTGCASGEEAYSIAILLFEARERSSISPKIQVFATDIDANGIDSARRARYTEGIVEHVSEKRLKRFFQKEGTSYEVAKSIRELCLFSIHDLIRDPPFARLDLLSCRNVMIYMGPELQRKLLPLFNYALKPNAYLLLGPTESVGTHTDLFKNIDKKARLFQNKLIMNRQPLSFPITMPSRSTEYDNTKGPKHSTPRMQEFTNYVDHYLNNNYLPPYVIINANHEVQFFSEGLKHYLSPTKGTPQLNLIQMAERSIRIELRSAVHNAIKEKKKVKSPQVVVQADTEKQNLQIIVEPLPETPYGENLYLVVFQPLFGYIAKLQHGDLSENKSLTESDAIEGLELELKDTKRQLQATIEELEHANEELKSSNEELLSMNEEMQSTNEELQTSQEEMQSINEELETVNTELGAKVELLDQANSDLTNLFKSIQIATLFLDNDLRIKRFTPEAKALFRIIDTDIDRPLTDFATRFSGSDLEVELNDVIRTLASRELTVQLESTKQWFRIKMHPYKTVKNVIEGAVVTFYDITQLKMFETELSARLLQQTVISNLGYKAFMEGQTVHSIFEHSVQLMNETLNTDYCKVLELLPSGNLKLVAGIGWKKGIVGQATVGADQDSQAGFTLKSEKPVIVKDLRTDPRFSGPKLLLDHAVVSGMSVIIQGAHNKPYGVLGVHTKALRTFTSFDVYFLQTIANILAMAIEREHLNRYRDRLANIVETSQDTILSHNFDGIILHWNTAATKLYGYTKEEAVGKSIFHIIVPSDKKEELIEKYQLVKKNKKVPPFETERVKKNGDRVSTLLSISPLIEDDEIIGISAIGRDISFRKKYERALIEARDSAQSANHLKSRFIATLGHELRTPFSSVVGYTDLCLHDASLKSKIKDHLLKVKANCELIQQLLEDLMDISKIEGGNVKVEKKWFSPEKIFQEIFSTLNPKASEKNLLLENKISGDFPESLYTDPLRLQQIIINIGMNAIKYTSEGKVSIEYKTEYPDDHHLILAIQISDTGIGMSKEVEANIFKPFYRANPGIGSPGVGLGLYISQQLAKLLDGEITIVSHRESKGSCFLLRIPVATPSHVEKNKKIASHSIENFDSSLTKFSILLADDNEDLRYIVKSYLEGAGAKVDEADNGKSALELALKKKFDFIILDLSMPDINGTIVMKRIKENKIETPVIALTAHASTRDRIKCFDEGFDDYISKPVTKEALIKKLLSFIKK